MKLAIAKILWIIYHIQPPFSTREDIALWVSNTYDKLAGIDVGAYAKWLFKRIEQ